jgi:hypothetical protein
VDVYEIAEGERKGPYDHLTAFIGRYWWSNAKMGLR